MTEMSIAQKDFDWSAWTFYESSLSPAEFRCYFEQNYSGHKDKNITHSKFEYYEKVKWNQRGNYIIYVN